VNERNLSRTLSTNIVDALKSQGHILVVKGGSLALARELEDLMVPRLAQIIPRIEPLSVVGGEVTSTFGHESIDEAVEEMVAILTRALMDSDHVEDVFAEDNVIRRDIFRSVRDGLLRPSLADASIDEDPSVEVALDTLGYVAATVSKRADPSTLREALSRAADVAMAHFTAYQSEARTATFVLQDDEPDGRLELEEAIADELTSLVEEGTVELPRVERHIDLGRPLSPADQRAAWAWIDATAKHTLRRAGCAATWELEGSRKLRVTFTPLSDQDARNVDHHIAAFARELTQTRGPAGVEPRLLPRSEGKAPPREAEGALRAAEGQQAAIRKPAAVAKVRPAADEEALYDYDEHQPSEEDEDEREEGAPVETRGRGTTAASKRSESESRPPRAAEARSTATRTRAAEPKRRTQATAAPQKATTSRKSGMTTKQAATDKRAGTAKSKAKATKASAKKRRGGEGA
jgi:hypothetical protein